LQDNLHCEALKSLFFSIKLEVISLAVNYGRENDNFNQGPEYRHEMAFITPVNSADIPDLVRVVVYEVRSLRVRMIIFGKCIA
jgi:hypothetical protein